MFVLVVGTWKDPVPGWTNSKNGPTGFIMGAATGVVRRLPVAKHLVYDYIPVDVVINAMIAAAVYTASQRER
jgi:fatty acyl-CoA reductase